MNFFSRLNASSPFFKRVDANLAKFKCLSFLVGVVTVSGEQNNAEVPGEAPEFLAICKEKAERP